MHEERAVKRRTNWRRIAVRRICKLRLSLKVDVKVYMEKMEIRSWSKVAMDREAWKRISEQAKTHKGL
jgi:hypothetical protein